jgi:hypothetical protein
LQAVHLQQITEDVAELQCAGVLDEREVLLLCKASGVLKLASGTGVPRTFADAKFEDSLGGCRVIYYINHPLTSATYAVWGYFGRELSGDGPQFRAGQFFYVSLLAKYDDASIVPTSGVRGETRLWSGLRNLASSLAAIDAPGSLPGVCAVMTVKGKLPIDRKRIQVANTVYKSFTGDHRYDHTSPPSALFLCAWTMTIFSAGGVDPRDSGSQAAMVEAVCAPLTALRKQRVGVVIGGQSVCCVGGCLRRVEAVGLCLSEHARLGRPGKTPRRQGQPGAVQGEQERERSAKRQESGQGEQEGGNSAEREYSDDEPPSSFNVYAYLQDTAVQTAVGAAAGDAQGKHVQFDVSDSEGDVNACSGRMTRSGVRRRIMTRDMMRHREKKKAELEAFVQEQAAKQAAEQAAEQAAKQLVEQAKQAEQLAEQEAELEAELEAKQLAEQEANQLAEQAEQAKQLAEQMAKQLAEQAEQEAKQLAEQAKQEAKQLAEQLAEQEAKQLAEQEAEQEAEQLAEQAKQEAEQAKQEAEQLAEQAKQEAEQAKQEAKQLAELERQAKHDKAIAVLARKRMEEEDNSRRRAEAARVGAARVVEQCRQQKAQQAAYEEAKQQAAATLAKAERERSAQRQRQAALEVEEAAEVEAAFMQGEITQAFAADQLLCPLLPTEAFALLAEELLGGDDGQGFAFVSPSVSPAPEMHCSHLPFEPAPAGFAGSGTATAGMLTVGAVGAGMLEVGQAHQGDGSLCVLMSGVSDMPLENGRTTTDGLERCADMLKATMDNVSHPAGWGVIAVHIGGHYVFVRISAGGAKVRILDGLPTRDGSYGHELAGAFGDAQALLGLEPNVQLASSEAQANPSVNPDTCGLDVLVACWAFLSGDTALARELTGEEYAELRLRLAHVIWQRSAGGTVERFSAEDECDTTARQRLTEGECCSGPTCRFQGQAGDSAMVACTLSGTGVCHVGCLAYPSDAECSVCHNCALTEVRVASCCAGRNCEESVTLDQQNAATDDFLCLKSGRAVHPACVRASGHCVRCVTAAESADMLRDLPGAAQPAEGDGRAKAGGVSARPGQSKRGHDDDNLRQASPKRRRTADSDSVGAVADALQATGPADKADGASQATSDVMEMMTSFLADTDRRREREKVERAAADQEIKRCLAEMWAKMMPPSV